MCRDAYGYHNTALYVQNKDNKKQLTTVKVEYGKQRKSQQSRSTK